MCSKVRDDPAIILAQCGEQARLAIVRTDAGEASRRILIREDHIGSCDHGAGAPVIFLDGPSAHLVAVIGEVVREVLSRLPLWH